MSSNFTSSSFPINSPSFYYVRINVDGTYTYVNDFFKRTFSHLSQAFVGERFEGSVHPDDLPLCQMAAECLEDTSKVVAVTLRKPDAGGNYFHTHWNFFAEAAADGKGFEIGCVGFDISTFVQQSGEHRLILQKLDAVLNSTHESFYLLDTHMRVLSFSQGARNVVKDFYGIDMYEGFDFRKQLLPGTIEGFTEQFNSALQGKKSFTENKLVFPTGKEIWFRLNIAPAYNESGEIFGVTLSYVNIDVLKKSEMQLKEIAWQQSHNVRKPLSNILGLVDLMKDERNYSKMQELFDMLQTSAFELDEKIKDIVSRTAL